VDLQALITLDNSQPESTNGLIAPRFSTEKRLAEIWRDILGIAEVGIHDDFFELGGHSLLGALLVFGANESFGVDLPIRILFEAPTIAAISVAILQCRAQQLPTEKLNCMLEEIERLSEEQAESMLADSKYAMSV
jgi:hypothetical protein